MRCVAILGVPWDEHSSFLRGASEGPRAFRAALTSESANKSTETGLDLSDRSAWRDAGDITIPESDPLRAIAAIEDGAQQALRDGAALLSIGGDHAISWPLVRAHAKLHRGLEILQFDAHPDLYDVFDGDRYSHACPFARIMEERLASRLLQIGIRTLNEAQRPQVARFGVEQIDMVSWDGADAVASRVSFDGPVYISLDLDVLDPAFAPGISHHEPGGLSVRDVIRIVQRFRGRLVGADIVELNPTRDRDGVTAMVAAKLAKELIARLSTSS
ncbi:MAG TPA: agmatinase [Vicinamibacterales bacterium]|jgi:agmatinase